MFVSKLFSYIYVVLKYIKIKIKNKQGSGLELVHVSDVLDYLGEY